MAGRQHFDCLFSDLYQIKNDGIAAELGSNAQDTLLDKR